MMSSLSRHDQPPRMTARRAGIAIFILFSLAWGWLSAGHLLGNVLGDCFEDVRCMAIGEWAPGYVLWRWLAIQLAAVIVLMLVRKR